MGLPPRRGQDPSLRAIVHGCFVGSGLDRSAGWADVSGLARRGGIHAAREPCAAANTPGGINPPLRIARKPSSAWRGIGDAAPYRRILFALSANSTFFIIYYLLSLIYLLFAAFVV